MPRPKKQKYSKIDLRKKKFSEWAEVQFRNDNSVVFHRATFTLEQGGNLKSDLWAFDGFEERWEIRCADFSDKTRATAIFLYLLKHQKSAVAAKDLVVVLQKHPNTSPSSEAKLSLVLDSTIRGLNKKFDDRGIRVAIERKNRRYRFSVPILNRK